MTAGGDTPEVPGYRITGMLRSMEGADLFHARAERTGEAVLIRVVRGAPDTEAPYSVVREEAPDSYAALLEREGRLDADHVVAVGLAVAAELEPLHEAGMVHNFISPRTLLLRGPGAELAATRAPALATGEAFPPLVLDRDTVAHLPPEAFDGGRVSPRADVYRLASTLWTLLAGRSPHADGPGQEVDFETYRERVTGPGEPGAPREDLPPGLDRVLRVAMSRAPRDRYPDARAFARALAAVRDGTVEDDTATPSEPRRRAPEIPEDPERPEERETASGLPESGAVESAPEEPGTVEAAAEGAGALEDARVPSEAGTVESVLEGAGPEVVEPVPDLSRPGAVESVPEEPGTVEAAAEGAGALEDAPLPAEAEAEPVGSVGSVVGEPVRDGAPAGAEETVAAPDSPAPVVSEQSALSPGTAETPTGPEQEEGSVRSGPATDGGAVPADIAPRPVASVGEARAARPPEPRGADADHAGPSGGEPSAAAPDGAGTSAGTDVPTAGDTEPSRGSPGAAGRVEFGRMLVTATLAASIVIAVVGAVALVAAWWLGPGTAGQQAVAPSAGDGAPPAASLLPDASRNPRWTPTDVRIVADTQDTVTLAWTDNSQGRASYHVVGGPVGAAPGTVAEGEPMTTRVEITGLNPSFDYCFTVVAVVSVDEVAPSENVCTDRFRSV
ncbi:hypothetical protein GCM10022630_10060 [Thermobifida alba]|uniref:hypothetical protein n=1 Tax=Thermobifida alba TaxID=53522 RepID=UPI0031E998B7